MGKAIYWIDDYSGAILRIAENIFPHFWKIDKTDGIETYVRLVGNAFQDAPGFGLWSKKEEQEMQEALIEQFQQICKDKDRFNRKNLYEQRKNLVCDKVLFVYKTSGDGAEKDEIEEYMQLCRLWQNSGHLEGDDEKRAKELAKKLYQRLEIKQGACVALDMALFQGDIEKVQKKESSILSMELYHLIKNEHPCFLYSYYVFDRSFISTWKELYKENYKDSIEPTIYSRGAMYAKKLTDEFINELLSWVDKPYGGETNDSR